MLYEIKIEGTKSEEVEAFSERNRKMKVTSRAIKPDGTFEHTLRASDTVTIDLLAEWSKKGNLLLTGIEYDSSNNTVMEFERNTQSCAIVVKSKCNEKRTIAEILNTFQKSCWRNQREVEADRERLTAYINSLIPETLNKVEHKISSVGGVMSITVYFEKERPLTKLEKLDLSEIGAYCGFMFVGNDVIDGVISFVPTNRLRRFQTSLSWLSELLESSISYLQEDEDIVDVYRTIQQLELDVDNYFEGELHPENLVVSITEGKEFAEDFWFKNDESRHVKLDTNEWDKLTQIWLTLMN